MKFDRSTGTEAACRRWAFTDDRVEATRAAREGRRARYARQVDPEGRLTPTERDRRIDSLIRADMVALARRRWAGSRKSESG